MRECSGLPVAHLLFHSVCLSHPQQKLQFKKQEVQDFEGREHMLPAVLRDLSIPQAGAVSPCVPPSVSQYAAPTNQTISQPHAAQPVYYFNGQCVQYVGQPANQQPQPISSQNAPLLSPTSQSNADSSAVYVSLPPMPVGESANQQPPAFAPTNQKAGEPGNTV